MMVKTYVGNIKLGLDVITQTPPCETKEKARSDAEAMLNSMMSDAISLEDRYQIKKYYVRVEENL